MKTFVKYAFSLCLVMLMGVDFVKADYKYDLNTFDTFGWEVAQLYAYGDAGYVNPTNSGGKYNNISGKNSATTWGSFNVNWNNVSWSAAEQGNRDTWFDHDNWLAASYQNDSKVANGFFAFKYTMTAADLANTLSVAGTLNLLFGADDYLAAVYANGDELYSQAMAQGAVVGNDENKNGSWLSLNAESFEVELVNGQLDLIFVVHNTNAANSAGKDNPMGLYLDGSISTNVEMIVPNEPGNPAATPEPATLLIFGFGLAGIGLAAKRRRK